VPLLKERLLQPHHALPSLVMLCGWRIVMLKACGKKCELIFEGAKFPKSCPHLLQIESGQQGSTRHPKNDRS